MHVLIFSHIWKIKLSSFNFVDNFDFKNYSNINIDIKHILWDSRASPEDMEQMWNHREVQKQWLKSRETRGQVRFCKDVDKGLYISKVELKVYFVYANTKYELYVSFRNIWVVFLVKSLHETNMKFKFHQVIYDKNKI